MTTHTNEAVKYFSGTATYSKTINLPAELLAKDNRVMLDLGQVESLAEVVVNGHNLGVFWKPPFIVDVTSAVRAICSVPSDLSLWKLAGSQRWRATGLTSNGERALVGN